jgi:hypothetical protein
MTFLGNILINAPIAEISRKLAFQRAKLMPILMQKHVKKGPVFAIFLTFLSLF